MTDKRQIKAQPKEVETLRAAVENQGKWIYFLTAEGLERGLNPDFAREAMYELGSYYGQTDFKDCDTPQALGACLMNRAMEKGREAEALAEGEALELKIGYCPMLNLWSQLTEDQPRKELLCGIACEMYRGLAESRGFRFEKRETIASGHSHCRFCFRSDPVKK